MPDYKIVDQIPPATRATPTGERDTELRKFCRWLSEQPAGTTALFKEAVKSPTYGGAQGKYPGIKFATRQVGSKEDVGRNGEPKTYKLYDVYATNTGSGGDGSPSSDSLIA